MPCCGAAHTATQGQYVPLPWADVGWLLMHANATSWACRVHTMALPAVDKLGNVFRGADLEASLSVLAVNMAAKVPLPSTLPP